MVQNQLAAAGLFLHAGRFNDRCSLPDNGRTDDGHSVRLHASGRCPPFHPDHPLYGFGVRAHWRPCLGPVKSRAARVAELSIPVRQSRECVGRRGKPIGLVLLDDA